MSLLGNACLLSMDGPPIDRGWISIDGSRITGLGEGEPPGPYEDMGGDVLMPGMVNPHGHLPMTVFRGLAEEVDDRLRRYILPLERACMDEATVRIGTRLALLESIRGGVTTVADMYYFEDAVAEELDASGLRGVLGQTIATFATPDVASLDEAFDAASALADRWRGHARVTPGIAPHAPYSTGLDVLRRVADWSAGHRDLPVQLHLAETTEEVAWAKREYACSTVSVVQQAGLLRPGLIAAHCIHLSDADMNQLASCGVGVAHCARANGKAGRPVAPVTALRARGVPVGLATDGAMSGNTLDVFSQFAPAAIAQKIATGTRATLSPLEILEMATVGGASVLGMAGQIGRLRTGYQADLVRVSIKDPRQQPVHDIHATLVYATLPSDVRATMVAGQWLMQEREVATLDTRKVLQDVRQTALEFGARVVEIDHAG